MGRYCQKSVAESGGSEKNIKRREMAIYGELSIEGGGGSNPLHTMAYYRISTGICPMGKK